jgi:hypothetical protein
MNVVNGLMVSYFCSFSIAGCISVWYESPFFIKSFEKAFLGKPLNFVVLFKGNLREPYR